MKGIKASCKYQRNFFELVFPEVKGEQLENERLPSSVFNVVRDSSATTTGFICTSFQGTSGTSNYILIMLYWQNILNYGPTEAVFDDIPENYGRVEVSKWFVLFLLCIYSFETHWWSCFVLFLTRVCFCARVNGCVLFCRLMLTKRH